MSLSLSSTLIDKNYRDKDFFNSFALLNIFYSPNTKTMSVKNNYSALVIFLLGALIFSCAREDVPDVTQEFDPNFPLSEAKSYFQERIGSVAPVDFSVSHGHDCDDPGHSHESTDTKNFTAVKSLIPDWGKATQVVKGDAIIFNIPLLEQDPYTAVLFFKKKGKTTTMDGSTVSTFVMAKETKTQIIRTFASTVIGEGVPEENIQSSSPWLFTGDKSAFTGFQIISNEKGNYLTSYVYDKGVINSIRLQYAKDNPKLIEQEEFFGYKLSLTQPMTKSVKWCPDCNRLWGSFDTVCGNCGNTFLMDTMDPSVALGFINNCPGCFFPLLYCSCNNGGNPFACPFCGSEYCFWQCRVGGCDFCGGPYCLGGCQLGGGSDPGGNGDPPTQPYTVQSGDVMAKSGLPTTMSTQLPNTCVTAIMEYINNNVFNGNANEGVYLLSYCQTYSVSIFNFDGVSPSNIVSFTNIHFTTSTFLNFQTAINSGAVIMTDIASSIPNSVHNVVILGYTSGGDYIYMDPELGYLCTTSESGFIKDYVIYITGTK